MQKVAKNNLFESLTVLHFVALFIVFISIQTELNAYPYEPVKVYTDTWSPFVAPEGEGLGPAQSTVRLIMNEADYEPEFVYLDYFQVYQLVEEKKINGAFPFFQTPARKGRVLFSKSLGETENFFYYDVYNFNEVEPDLNNKQLVIGRVIGYSYGENIDSILENKEEDSKKVFSSELRAFQALISNEIDLLPMAEKVHDSMLHDYFPDYTDRMRNLIQKDEQGRIIKNISTYHLIAPDNEAGKVFIEKFNAARDSLEEAGIKLVAEEPLPTKNPHNSGYVRLTGTDNIPFIIGQDSEEANNSTTYFAIPLGTRGVVLEWSESIRNGSKGSKSLFSSMNDFSQLEIISGPHIGKELWVKNIHIEIE